MPGSRTAAWCLILAMLLAPVPGRAGETIADPANESVGGESDDPGDGDRSAESGTAGGDDTDDGTREEDDTGETIVDPANRSGGDTGRAPAAQAGADRRSAETGSGNESSGAGDAVDVRGDWSSSLSIDADWSEPGEDIVELHSSIGLALDHQLSSRTRVSIAGSVRHWVAGKRVPGGPNYLFNARQPRAAFEARLGESYLLHRTDRWSFRVGHLLVPWGRTELIRPGAVINGRDLS
ncbi:MAG: hypothetical protein ABEL76_07135, partial [Bradymonadaceae bacterium]